MLVGTVMDSDSLVEEEEEPVLVAMVAMPGQ